MENTPFAREKWISIDDYGGKYLVSDHGRVKHRNGNILKTRVGNRGYETVSLFHNSKNFSKSVHRLVAQAFIPNPDNKPQVNHIDGDKLNNNVGNLEWATGKENMRHKIYVLKEQHTLLGRITPVICVETGEKFISVRDASRKMNIDSTTISRCVSRSRADSFGRHWEKC